MLHVNPAGMSCDLRGNCVFQNKYVLKILSSVFMIFMLSYTLPQIFRNFLKIFYSEALGQGQ